MPWLTTKSSPLLPLLFVVAFVWVSLAIGRRLLIVLGASCQGSVAERGIIALGLGAGALEYVPFALGTAGCLGTGSLRVASGFVVLAAAWDLRTVALAVGRGARNILRTSSWERACAAALLPPLVIAGICALAPTIDPDGMGYHLTVPKRWLQSGRLEYLPTYPYSNAPMGVEMLFAFGLAVAGDAAAKCVHFTLGVTGVIGLYLAGKRLQGPVAGAVAATLFLVGPWGVSGVLGWAYVEGAAAFAMISASLAWILWFQLREPGLLRCAALLAGVAVTFKITSVLFPVGLLALTIVAALDPASEIQGRGGRVTAAFAFAARPLALVFVPIIPWMARAAIVTGNPIYPLFARWIPSRDFSPDLSAKFDRHNRLMTWGNVIGQNWTIEQRTFVLLSVCAVTLLLGFLAFARMRSWMARGTVVVVTMIALAQIAAAGLYIRYSIPLAAVLTLPLVSALGPLLSRKAFPAIWLSVTLVASLLQARRSLAQADSDVKGLIRIAFGLEDRRAFLLRHLLLFPLYEQANRDLPWGAGVMLSCQCSGFYIDRTTFCAEMVQNSLRFTNWQDFTSDLRRLGITHVIAPTALATGGPAPPLERSNVSAITRDNQVLLVRELLVNYSMPRATAADQGLYDINPALLSTH